MDGGEAVVVACHECVVYVLAPVSRVLLVRCSDCTVVVGAVGYVLRAEQCERMHVAVATHLTAVSACCDCTFYLGTPRPPVLLGDNRFISLGPYNTRYPNLVAHVLRAGLRPEGN